MASYLSASESAIKRAKELMEENNVYDALRTLNDFIAGKKKYTAQPSALEKVMVRIKHSLIHLRLSTSTSVQRDPNCTSSRRHSCTSEMSVSMHMRTISERLLITTGSDWPTISQLF